MSYLSIVRGLINNRNRKGSRTHDPLHGYPLCVGLCEDTNHHRNLNSCINDIYHFSYLHTGINKMDIHATDQECEIATIVIIHKYARISAIAHTISSFTN